MHDRGVGARVPYNFLDGHVYTLNVSHNRIGSIGAWELFLVNRDKNIYVIMSYNTIPHDMVNKITREGVKSYLIWMIKNPLYLFFLVFQRPLSHVQKETCRLYTLHKGASSGGKARKSNRVLIRSDACTYPWYIRQKYQSTFGGSPLFPVRVQLLLNISEKLGLRNRGEPLLLSHEYTPPLANRD
jgi:hypothetical protein